ncbi:MAG: Asp-tRNA(Asn)/Glu-tRNA(Gln) amidotransferase subunit GatB [Actinobacteria bacterium]|nr:Asp-tRNA(Asn)/Glu-tRNA(Gln) amidotransferase subunit GatB [Actinomycetota bacterium]MCI0679046.1 Asp-tRNA(Asn)/Glu-tRNA(Gln) amidotransferase subunit GatB [Actinomycetota bacterium]
MTWEPVIGVEVHVELSTRSKMFCGCAVDFTSPPNTNVCPVCLGLPGALPVPNRRAIEHLMSIGLALGSEVSSRSVFHRKNYFYADLPKNYQISQYDVPVCRGGHLDITVDGETRRIGIERAHMEEDTGKSTHVGLGGRIHAASATLLDFNRSGVPLVEIVSRPDIHSASDARVFAQELRGLVLELGVSDARLEEGSLRFDANVSIRPAGSTGLGTKVEIKNMNSFRSLERAVDHEVSRQIGVAESGGELVQETRHWDEEAGVTHPMRTKEGSSDYRYFTEPDLVPMTFDDAWISSVAATLPELPAQRRSRYQEVGLDGRQAATLAESPPRIRQVFDEATGLGADPTAAFNWLSGEVVSHLRRAGLESEELHLGGAELFELVTIVEEGLVSATAAKEVLEGVLTGEGGPREVASSRDLIQVSDATRIGEVVDAVLTANPDAVAGYRDRGEEKVVGFLVGQVMRQTQGKADPRVVNELLREKLASQPGGTPATG